MGWEQCALLDVLHQALNSYSETLHNKYITKIVTSIFLKIWINDTNLLTEKLDGWLRRESFG